MAPPGAGRSEERDPNDDDAPGRSTMSAAATLVTGWLFVAAAAMLWSGWVLQGERSVARKPAGAAEELVRSLRVPTEYVTCLVRFGRVFFGLGQVTLAVGLWVGGLLPAWIALVAALLGGAAMAVTMVFPDDLHFFRPVFHLDAAWLLAIGLVLLVPWAS